MDALVNSSKVTAIIVVFSFEKKVVKIFQIISFIQESKQALRGFGRRYE